MLLDKSLFRLIVNNTPLVSIDLIISNFDGKVLFGKRTNCPARGFWFVPGGRILKDETLQSAFERLTLNELGMELDFCIANFLGVYQHFYADNFTGESDFTTHYLVLGYTLVVDEFNLKLPTEQHEKYCWLDRNSILDNKKIHEYSKDYFRA